MANTQHASMCTCPICRYHRKEISPQELAWYLKGKIEAKASLEDKMDKFQKYSLIEDEAMLHDLISNNNLDEPAFEHPREFVL